MATLRWRSRSKASGSVHLRLFAKGGRLLRHCKPFRRTMQPSQRTFVGSMRNSPGCLSEEMNTAQLSTKQHSRRLRAGRRICPFGPRLCRPRRHRDRRLNIQDRPIGAPWVTTTLAAEAKRTPGSRVAAAHPGQTNPVRQLTAGMWCLRTLHAIDRGRWSAVCWPVHQSKHPKGSGVAGAKALSIDSGVCSFGQSHSRALNRVEFGASLSGHDVAPVGRQMPSDVLR